MITTFDDKKISLKMGNTKCDFELTINNISEIFSLLQLRRKHNQLKEISKKVKQQLTGS